MKSLTAFAIITSSYVAASHATCASGSSKSASITITRPRLENVVPLATWQRTVTTVCFNCDQIGHVAKNCPEDMKCCICKSQQHKAIDCPLSWYRRPVTHRERNPAPVHSQEIDHADAVQPEAVQQRAPPLGKDTGSFEILQANDPDPSMEDTATTSVGVSEADPLAVAIPTKAPQAILDSQGFFVPPTQPTDLPE